MTIRKQSKKRSQKRMTPSSPRLQSIDEDCSLCSTKLRCIEDSPTSVRLFFARPASPTVMVTSDKTLAAVAAFDEMCATIPRVHLEQFRQNFSTYSLQTAIVSSEESWRLVLGVIGVADDFDAGPFERALKALDASEQEAFKVQVAPSTAPAPAPDSTVQNPVRLLQSPLSTRSVEFTKNNSPGGASEMSGLTSVSTAVPTGHPSPEARQPTSSFLGERLAGLSLSDVDATDTREEDPASAVAEEDRGNDVAVAAAAAVEDDDDDDDDDDDEGEEEEEEEEEEDNGTEATSIMSSIEHTTTEEHTVASEGAVAPTPPDEFDAIANASMHNSSVTEESTGNMTQMENEALFGM